MMRSLSSCFEANWMWRRIQTRTAERGQRHSHRGNDFIQIFARHEMLLGSLYLLIAAAGGRWMLNKKQQAAR
jgi:hypothetical protein